MNQREEDRSLWFMVLAIGAFSLWVVATKRSQNPLWPMIAALSVFALAYRFYGRFVALHVARASDAPDGESQTERSASLWSLGYHFAAIAGVGALVAPVAIVQYGFLPGVLWVLVGASLAGTVHDFVALLVSVRHDGRPLPQIVRDGLGLAAPALALLLLITLVAVLSAVAAALLDLLAGDAGVTYALALTVPTALFVTLYVRFLRPGHSGEALVAGLALFALTVIAGSRGANAGFTRFLVTNERSLTALLAVYCLIAAWTPIRALSLVRGALSGYLILGATGLMAVVLAFAASPLQVAPTTAFVRGGGPLLAGGAFPTVGIVLTAGAVSGFHALITSGPTAQLVRREGQALPVGFGAMLLVGFLSLLVLVVTATLSPGDFVAINTPLPPEQIAAAAGTPPSAINQLRDQLGQTVAARPGGSATLAVAVVQVFKTLPKAKSAWALPLYRAVKVLAALLLFAALEAGVRAGWLLVRDWDFAPALSAGLRGLLGRLPALRLEAGDWLSVTVDWSQVFAVHPSPETPAHEVPANRLGLGGLLATLVVVAGWATLSLGASPRFTDPLIGVSSLLLAAVILCLGTAWVMPLHSGRRRYLALVTLIPALTLLLIGLVGGTLGVRELWSQANAQRAFKTAYQELPTLATRQELIPIERAWTTVREMPVGQASDAFASGGRDGLAQALSARFGESVPREGARLADLVVGRARAVRLWSHIQLAAMILAMILALILAGASAAQARAAIKERPGLPAERTREEQTRPRPSPLLSGLGGQLRRWKAGREEKDVEEEPLLPPVSAVTSGPVLTSAVQDIKEQPPLLPVAEEVEGEGRREAEGEKRRPWVSTGARSLVFVVSIALSLLGSRTLYHRREDLGTAVLLYAGSLVCLRLAFYEGVRRARPVRRVLTALGHKLRAHRQELLWLSLIFAVAVFFRVYRFGYFPPADGVAFEETQAGGDAFKALRLGHRTVEFPLTVYLPALSFALFGESTTTLRLPFLILGCLTVLPFYFLLRELVDCRVALFGTFLLAVSRWHAVVSRMADELFIPIFFEVLILYLIIKSHKTKEVRYFFWLAILSAYMLYAYIAYRVITFLVLLLLIGRSLKAVINQLQHRRQLGDCLRAVFRAGWRPALVFVVAFLTVASPLLVVTRQGDRFFVEAFLRVSAGEGETIDLPALSQRVDRLKAAPLIFTHQGESYPALNLPGEPMLDPVSGVLFVLGIAYSLLTFFRPYRLWFLLWIAVVIVVGAVFPPNLYVGRFSNLIPVVFVVISFMMGDLSNRVRHWGERSQRRRQRMFGACLVLLAGAALVLNFHTLFVRQVSDSQVRRAYRDRVVALCNYIASLGLDTYSYVWDRDQRLDYVFLPSDYVWLCHGIRGEAVSDMESVLPARVQANQVAYIFVNPVQSVDELSRLISQFYPQTLAPSATIEGEGESYRIVAYLLPPSSAVRVQ